MKNIAGLVKFCPEDIIHVVYCSFKILIRNVRVFRGIKIKWHLIQELFIIARETQTHAQGQQ